MARHIHKDNRRGASRCPSQRPQDGIPQHPLEPIIAPHSFLVVERCVEDAAAPVGPAPRQRPSVGTLVHVWVSEVDRGGIEAQKHVGAACVCRERLGGLLRYYHHQAA
jgi:hypothetical protein